MQCYMETYKGFIKYTARACARACVSAYGQMWWTLSGPFFCE